MLASHTVDGAYHTPVLTLHSSAPMACSERATSAQTSEDSLADAASAVSAASPAASAASSTCPALVEGALSDGGASNETCGKAGTCSSIRNETSIKAGCRATTTLDAQACFKL